MNHFDPRTLRRAAGLTIDQAAKLVHAAPSTWKNWEKSGAVTPKRAAKIQDAMCWAMFQRIKTIQAMLDEIDAHR